MQLTPVGDGVEICVQARLPVVDRCVRYDARVQDTIDLHMLGIEEHVFSVGRRLDQDVVFTPEESLVVTRDD